MSTRVSGTRPPTRPPRQIRSSCAGATDTGDETSSDSAVTLVTLLIYVGVVVDGNGEAVNLSTPARSSADSQESSIDAIRPPHDPSYRQKSRDEGARANCLQPSTG